MLNCLRPESSDIENEIGVCIKNRRETAARRRRREKKHINSFICTRSSQQTHQAFDCILLLLRPLRGERKRRQKVAWRRFAFGNGKFSLPYCDLSLLNEPIN
jgi:hypothetical protein